MLFSTASSPASALLALTLAVSSAMADRVPFELVKERAGARTSSPVSGGSILAGAPMSNITVTPSGVVQCGTATVQWTGVVEPVQLFIAVGGMYVGETPLATLSGLSGGSTTWQVAAPAGDTLIFQITDANNQVGYIQNIAVQSSGDASCLAAASATSSSGGTGAASASPSDDDSSAAPSTAASTPVASASPDTVSTSDADAAAATSSSSNSKATSSATQAAVTAATTAALTIATPKTTASTVAPVSLAGAQSTPQSSVTSGASIRAGPAMGIATLLSGAAILASLL